MPVSTINRNKIKIQPLSRPISPSLHIENETASSSIQKTSIKINTDECSSTVKVNDSVKSYHSSVLINVSSHQIENLCNQYKSADVLNSDSNLSSQAIEDWPHFSEKTKTAIAILHTNTNERSSEESPSREHFCNENSTKTLIPIINDFDNKKLFSNSDGSLANKKAKIETSSKAIDLLVDNSLDQKLAQRLFVDSFILKVLSDPCLSHLLHGLEVKSIANIIRNSLVRIPINKYDLSIGGTKESEIDDLLLKQLHDIMKEERRRIERSMTGQACIPNASQEKSIYCNTGGPDKESSNSEAIPIQKICEILTGCSLGKKGDTPVSFRKDHQYESICLNYDPIYEEINDEPPPLPKGNGNSNKSIDEFI